MNILLVSRKEFALHLPLSSGFIELGHTVTIINPEELVSNLSYRINASAFRLPYVLRNKWDEYFFKRMNSQVLAKAYELKPEIVLVYNHGWLIPDTIKKLRKFTKVFFYIVDSPLYTKQSHFLYNLFEADRVIAIDSLWVEQLKRMGIHQMEFGLAGVDRMTFKRISPSQQEINEFSTDLIYFGNCPSAISGFKRALFLNQFVDLDIRIHGGADWYKWFDKFPRLKDHFILRKKPYSFEKMNLIYNCCKIAPIDTNPGVLNGIHPKLFECIGAGILPVLEYRKDTETVFGQCDIPLIRNYGDAAKMVESYLNDEEKRLKKAKLLQDFVLQNYTSVHFANKIISYALE